MKLHLLLVIPDKMKQSMFRLFEDWEHQIARPIVVALLTAALLFITSLLLTPVRNFFFPPEVIDYPLLCFPESHKGAGDLELIVDFFIANPTDQLWTQSKLTSELKRHAQAGGVVSPDINLKYWRKVGVIKEVKPDLEFNKSKGFLMVKFDHESNAINVQIASIEKYSMLKFTILIDQFIGLSGIERKDKDLIPLNVKDYLTACYSR